ncbi:MAG: hypothetical protein ACI4I3_01935 [Acutalibacteraceae bacterium]
MANKFNFETAEALSAKLNTVADLLENENKVIKGKYSDLGETFRDSGYTLYQMSFNECDRNICDACATLRDLSVSLMVYAQHLREAM